MPIFGPITTDRKVRRFGVFDLEWVPGETLPPPENLDVEIVGLRDGCRIPLPPRKVMTKPLQLRMAGYYDQQVVGADEDGDEVERVAQYQSFTTVRELIDFLLSRDHRGMWFFAHAGGLADMQFVLDELLTEIKSMSGVGRTTTVVSPDGSRKTEEHVGSEWKIRASFSGSSAIIVHVSKGKNAWHFCDSYWLLRDKLSSIGKAIGIKKGDSPEAKAWMSKKFGREITDFDELSQPEKVVFYREVPMSILTGYNRTDCEILWKAIFQFEDEILGLGGQLQQTIASTAMTLFRRSYLQQEIYTSEKLNQVAQESYFASRVEVLSRNAEDFLMYDINSSFPYAMTFALPGNLTGFQTTLPDDDRDECLYLANVTFEVPDTHMPPLPFRRDGRVFFPVGRWRAWLTSTDIRLALREGAILHKVHEVYTFEPFWDFRAYAEEIYSRRAASETPFRKLVLKYLLNSLYGKAAEGIVKQEMLINPDEVDRTKMQMLQPGVWLQEKEAVIAHRHVVVSSFITAIARRTLFDFAKECYRQEKPLMYCDSVTGDRPLVLRSPDGRVVVDPIEETWGRVGVGVDSWHGDKESVAPEGWSALVRDSRGVEGWFPLKRIVRHKTSKPVYLVSSKRGQVGVTEDHSLMVGGVETKPADFVERGSQFDVVKAPPPVVAETIDLLSYLRGFQRIIETDEYHGGRIVHQFVADEEPDWIRLTTSYRESPQRFRRYYSRGTEGFRSLLRVTAAFISEGSSSLRGVTTDTRDMFSLCQKSRGWLDSLKRDIKFLTDRVALTGPKWSDGSSVYYLRSGAALMACLFGELGGVRGSRGRKLPAFIYELDDADFEVFWKTMVEGDGTIDPWGYAWYTTISQQLAAGLSLALSQHGYDHSIHYRPSKKSYTIRLRKTGVERKGRKTHVEVSQYEGFVYDLEVEGAHTFVDGVGRVLLHNTDSLATKADLPVDDKRLGALKLEKKMDWAEFVAPKIYRGEGYELGKDGTWTEKRLNKAKGFSLGSGKAAFDKLGRIVGGERVGIQRMTRLRELYRTQVDGQYVTAPFEMMVVKALTFETLCKRFHYPDGETRPWSIEELKSGDCYPKGFDFDEDSWARVDDGMKAAMARLVRS